MSQTNKSFKSQKELIESLMTKEDLYKGTEMIIKEIRAIVHELKKIRTRSEKKLGIQPSL